MAFDDTTEPITDDDATIVAALEQAEIGALLPALAYATGDRSLLRPEFQIDPLLMLMPDAAPPPEVQAEARRLAFDALVAYRDAGSTPVPPPAAEDLRAMLEFAVGGTDMGDYLELFREELGIEGDDLRAPSWRRPPDRPFTVGVIGAGMSGLLAAHRLKQAGLDVIVFEKNADVGGTWLENSYPGCRVDVPNHFYSYSFAQKRDWPQHFSSQDVLLDYFRSCADEFGVRHDIRFDTEIEAAEWDEQSALWQLHLAGSDETVSVNAVVSAVGQLNRPLLPDIAGRERFEGPSFHSAQWRHDVDLEGKRVAVIGTGASAAQLIPVVAERAAHLTVFQRTPNWLIPTPDYHDPVSAEQAWLFRHVPSYAHWYRFWLFWRNAEGMLPLVRVDESWEPKDESVSPANELLREFLAQYLREQFEGDDDLLAKVLPHYPPASKRVIRDNGIWSRTLRRDDVDLVTDEIAEITPTGVRTLDGVEHEVDVIVYGTGFQASRFLTPMKVVGRGGVDIHDRWHGDARAYLGITIPGFPNLFLTYGPNTNIVINGSIIFFSECEVAYVLDCLRVLFERDARALDCRPEAHDRYNEWVDRGNLEMAWGVATQVNSWYRNETGRSAQNWPFSLLEYWQQTRSVDPGDYDWSDGAP